MEKQIDWVAVESSNLAAISYDDGKIYVKFKNGGVYAYTGGSFATVAAVLTADSVGSAFHKMIKPLPFEKLA